MAEPKLDLFQTTSNGTSTSLSPVSLTSPGITNKSQNPAVPNYNEESLFFVTNSKGDLIGATSGLSRDTVTKYKSGDQPLYYNSTTGISTQSASKVSLDEKTGKITLETSNPSFTEKRAEKLIENLKTMSANYKANPNYAYQSSDNPKETKTIKDIIKEYNTPDETTGLNVIDTYGAYYQNIDIEAANLSKSHNQITENGKIVDLQFDDDDMLNYFTNFQALQTAKSTSNDSLTNDTRLAIPSEVIKNSGVRFLESWDDETGTVGLKEFMEKLYNRQTADWDERQEVNPTTGSVNLGFYNALEQYIKGQAYTIENGQAVFTHRDDQTAQLATAISLYNFLTEVDPLCSFWQGAGDHIASLFNSVESAAEKGGEAAATVLVMALDAGAWVGARIREMAGSKLVDEKASYPSRLIAKWAGYNRGESFYEVSGSVREQGVLKIQAEISKYNASAASTFAVGEFLSEMAIMIAIGNAFSNAAEAGLKVLAGSAAEGAATLASVPSLANGVYSMWQLSGNVAKAASVTLNLVSQTLSFGPVTAGVSVLAESVGEALIQNPSLVGQILSGDNLSEEARQFALSTVAGNALGFGLGHIGSKAIQKFGQTTLGKAVNKNINRFLWTVKTWAGDSMDAVRVAFSSEDDIADIIRKGNPNKVEVRLTKREIRAIQKVVLDETNFIKILGMSSDDIAEQLAKYDNSLAKYYNLENALDRMASRGIYTAASIVSDPNVALSGSYKTWSKLGSELVELGQEAGLKATKLGGVSVLPEQIAEYITTKSHLDILNSYARAIENGFDVGESLNAIQKEITHFTTVLEDVRSSLSEAIIAKSDDFIDANRKLWSDWTDYRVEHGLLDATQIDNLRKSGQWGESGELYVGQMRKVEQPKYTIKRKDNLRDVNALEEIGAYKFGSTNGFVDPMLTFQSSLIDSAQKADRMIVFRQFVGTDMVTTKYTASQLKLVESVKAGRKSLANGVREAYEGSLENLATGKMIDAMGDLVVKGDKLNSVAKELAKGDIVSEIDDIVDGYIDLLSTGNSKVNSMLDSLVKEYAPNTEETARKLLVADALQDGIDDFGDKVRLTLLDELKAREIDGKLLDVAEINKVADDITDRIKQNIKDRYDYYRVEISRAGEKAQLLIDRDAWNREISELAEEIGDAKAHSPNIVTARNANGEIEIYECDPLLATFMNVAGPVSKMSDGMLAKVNYAWMKLFRFGTTGPNPVSWVNQFFRDFGNAWLVGGATKTIAQATDILEEAFGSNPAYYLSQLSDDMVEAAQKTATETGKTLERVLAESEIEYGSEIVGKQTEHEALNAYRRMRDLKYINGEIDTSLMSRAAEKADDLMDKADWVNKTREEWLRSRVYANSFAEAISEGKTISQARTWAEFYSSNATTNFTRATGFLSSIQNTVPYLRSAINGTKSFWRIWQVDPVGVTGRIVGGLVMPMVGLMCVTLSDERNRQVYRNIKEYQKDGSLAFVVGGQAFFIPIPQEISNLIAPIRQVVESMYNVSTNSFSELAFSDILGLSPIDLSGFASLDNYKIFEDGFWERLQSGVTKVAAQCLPKYANTLIALSTNRDLYTGNRIDTSYTTIDPDTGEARVMDYTSGEFAKWLHSVFPGISAAMAENILKNTIGQVGIGAGNWLVDLVQSASGEQNWSQFLENMASGLAGAVTSPLTNYVPYDEAQAAWRQAVSEMYDYKNALMNSDEYKAYMSNATKVSSEAQIDALSVQRQNIVEPYFDKVKQMVTNYQQNYGHGLTQAQLASVISLMVIYQRTSAEGPLADEANEQAYASARASALSTMNRLGFTSAGPQDSIFGRIRTSSSGEVYVEYNNPIEILDFKKMYSIAPDVHTVQIKQLLDGAGLSTQVKWDGYYKLSTKAEKTQYMKDWNAKVTKALAPYVQKYGVEAIFRNAEISEDIDDYFFTNNYYSAKKYLQKIFGD